MTDSSDEHLARGLMRFYSSQVEVMLAQYRNINDLLGPTTHHTHPGTHCEVLLRSCIRQILPPAWSADKGFIFGRIARQGETIHSPEIDILIHDESIIRPLFRLEDFVIVHPNAVLGMIQVKKSFAGDQLKRGVENVVQAKQHLFDLSRQNNAGKLRLERFPFSAVVGFEGDLPATNLASCLADVHMRHQAYRGVDDATWKTSVLVLPDYIGTLNGTVALANDGADRKGYSIYNSIVDQTHFAIQLLYWKFSRTVPDLYLKSQPLAFPSGLQPLSAFTVGDES